MILVNDESVLMEYEEAFGLLYYERRRSVKDPSFRETMQQAFNMVGQKKVRFWLINVAEADRIIYEDQTWLMEKLDENFCQNQVLEKVALVPPKDIYNLMAAESILEFILNKIHFEFQYFSDAGSARDWLEESYREICFHDEGLEIEYDAFHHWIYANWKGNHTLDSVRRGCGLIADLLDTKKCHKLLNDNRLAIGQWMDAAPWIVTDLVPRMEQNGLTAVAWILSPSTLHRLSSLKVLELNNSGIQVEAFNEFHVAKKWLHEISKAPTT